MDFKPTQVNDKRCTRVGRWLRRSRLDEPPQLYNILWGDMHFLGPSAFRTRRGRRTGREDPSLPASLDDHSWCDQDGAKSNCATAHRSKTTPINSSTIRFISRKSLLGSI